MYSLYKLISMTSLLPECIISVEHTECSLCNLGCCLDICKYETLRATKRAYSAFQIEVLPWSVLNALVLGIVGLFQVTCSIDFDSQTKVFLPGFYTFLLSALVSQYWLCEYFKQYVGFLEKWCRLFTKKRRFSFAHSHINALKCINYTQIQELCSASCDRGMHTNKNSVILFILHDEGTSNSKNINAMFVLMLNFHKSKKVLQVCYRMMARKWE